MNRIRLIACSVLALAALSIAWLARPLNALPAPSAHAKVRAAWQRANDLGAYHYNTEIVQTTWPELVLENVGLSSRTERLYVEGDTDTAARTMAIKLWSDSGSTATNDGAIELRVSSGKTEGRVGASAWKEVGDVSSLFAPGQDPLAYLAGARDVVELGTETRGGQVSVTRYGFQLDGPAFAAHMRELMEEELVRRGELPPGIQLELARTYVGMSGQGEIWLDNAGLPLRQIIHAAFPPQYGEQVELEITTDFSQWADQVAKKSQPGVIGFLLPTPYSLFPLLLLAIVASLVTLLVSLPSRMVYNAVALAVIASMLVTPLLQSQHVYAFAEKQAAANARAERDRQAAQQRQEAQASLYTKDFDPHKDPLEVSGSRSQVSGSRASASASTLALTLSSTDPCAGLVDDPGTDTDGDSLTDAQEACIGTNAAAADTDSDGLSDGVEVYELGTNPLATDDDGDGVPDGRDSDGDGLSDSAEVRGFWDAAGKRWYSNPLDFDTNGDGIADGVEFPRKEDGGLDCPDPDGDGVPTCQPQDVDTDRDGVPDGFDFDDDGDLVPDRIDATRTLAVGSRQAGQIAGLADGRFDFEITDVRLDTPLYADFQLRPVNPDHLWYTMNVLDWPSGDTEGQVQRVHDTTFGASGKEANGDMRLVPMLEIIIPYRAGHYGNLPVLPGSPTIEPSTPVTAWLDKRQTDMFNVSVRKFNSAGDLAAYVPLVLVQDPAGSGAVAMSGRMFYWPSVARADQPGLADGGPAQTARLVWLIQSKTDTCIMPVPDDFMSGQDDTERYEAWCGDLDNWDEGETVVHTYYDDWYLTGFSVREDRGLETGIVFEDPDYALAHAYDANTYYEAYLWSMAANLDETFIAARSLDTNGDGQGDVRDMTLDDIWTRFNVNSTSSSTERWDIPAGATQVVTQAFAHQSYIAHIPMTYTKQVLNDYFMSGSQPTAKIANPTLLFVREETFRSLSLDGAASSAAVQNGVLLSNTLKMALTSGTVPETVLAGMNWAPYLYDADAGVWEADPVDEYVAKLKARLGPTFEADSYFPPDETILDGAKFVAGSFYLAMFAGLSSVVEMNSVPLTMAYAKTDAAVSYSLAKIGGSIARTIVDELASQVAYGATSWWTFGRLLMDSKVFTKLFGTGSADDVLEVLLKTGQETGGISATLLKMWRGQSALGRAGKPLLVIGAVAAVGIAVFLITAIAVDMPGLDYVLQGIALVVSLALVGKAIYGMVQAAGAWGGGLAGLKAAVQNVAGTVTKAAVIAAVVGLIVIAAMSIGFFVYGMIAGGVKAGSLAFDKALANMVATIIVAAIMLAISLIPIIGPLIVAIIGAIDAIIMTVCMIVEAAADPSGLGWDIVKNYVCGGISGLLTKLVELFIYDQTPLIDLQAPERMTPTNFSVDVSDLSKGMAVGNRLLIGADVFTALYRNAPFEPDKMKRDIEALFEDGDFDALQSLFDNFGIGIFYIWQFADAFVNDATFRYAFTVTDTETLDVSIKQMEDEWQKVEGGWLDSLRYTTTQHINNGNNIVFTQAGLNWQPDLYLAENYAMQAQECTTIPPGVPPNITPIPIPVCWLRPTEDTLHIYLGDSFKFDVFPASLDEFYALASRGDGSYALAWDSRFPTLADADGDGLRSQAAGGNDPDDGFADSDFDGLPDYYEVQHNLDTGAADSDGDGLSDYEDVARGCDPARADSDGDGLWDKEELDGWPFVYAFDSQDKPLFTRVTSDPNNPDTDDDGIIDKLEQVYHFNPRVYSRPEVLAITSAIDDADGYVRPGQAIAYTATVENKLRDIYALGLLEVDFPAAVQNTSIQPQVYTLPPREQIALTGQVTVRSDAPSQPVSLTNRAGASMTDLRGEAGGRVLWLALNESAGATRFVDNSLLGNDGTCSGTSCPTAGQPGYAGLAAQFDGTDDYIALGNPSNLPAAGNISLVAWIKPGASSGTQAIIEHGYSLSPPGEVFLRLSGGYYQVGSWDGMAHMAQYAIPAGDLEHWTHLAGVYDGSYWILYRNGVEVARQASSVGAVPVNADWAVGARGGGGERYFKGLIDEVAIYPQALTAGEVAAMVTRPVFQMNLDSRSCSEVPWLLYLYRKTCRYTDQVGNVQGICEYIGPSGDYSDCPYEMSGALRGGMYFGGRTFEVPSTAVLDLSGGNFSQAMWIKPDATTTHRQGVWGYSPSASGGANPPKDSYPSVYIVNQDGLEVGFGDGAAWRSCVVDNVLSLNQWNHVAVTYDGQYKIYVNGVEKGSCTLGATIKPASSSRFDVGRATHCATMINDGGLCRYAQRWDAGNAGNTEIKAYFNDDFLWRQSGLNSGDDITQYATRNYCGSGTLHVWEDDDGEAGDSDDMGTFTVYATDASASYTPQFVGGNGFEGDATVDLDVQNVNPSIPFGGGLDELAIYKRTLSAQDVLDLYQGAERVLEIRLDEAPGRDVFYDSSGNAYNGTCSRLAGTCPDSGLPGRFNQAARFDGLNDYVDLGPGPALVGQEPFAVAAWIKTSGSTANQLIIQQRSASVYNGEYQLMVKTDGNLRWMTYGDGQYGFDLSSAGALVNDGNWHHVIGVRESDGKGRIYIDGVERGSAAGTPRTLVATNVYIGCDKRDNKQYFNGLIDHVVLVKKAFSSADAQALMDEAPILSLHLDEALLTGAITTTAFANAANASRDGSCKLTPLQNECGCPAAGDKGWMRQGVVFAGTLYGNDANQCISVPDGSAPAGLSVGGWFKLSKERWSTDQELIRKPGSYNLYIQRSVSAGGAIKAGFDTASSRRSPQAVNSVISSGDVMLNQWTHIVGTFNPASGKASIYINGSLQGSADSPTPLANSGVPVEIGRNFLGLADELVLYNRALPDRDIKDLYEYQVHWYDTSYSHDLTIDADAPSVRLDLPAEYLANRDVVMAIVADDPSSPVSRARYRVDGSAWADAVQDQNTWLFTFNPDHNLSEGAHTIDVRAVDSVGNRTDSSKTLTIDATGPLVSLDSSYTLHALDAHNTLVLAGTVTDAASGVDKVYVTLLDGRGVAATSPQLAQLAPPDGWQATFSFALPLNGRYSVRLEALDKVGNPSSNASRASMFSSRTRQSLTRLALPVIELDGTPPLADITDLGPSTYVISGTGASQALVTGTVSNVPYPTGQVLHMHLEEAGGAERFYDGSAYHFQATCSGASCPQAGLAGRYGLGPQFDGGDSLSLGRNARLGTLAGSLSVMAWVNLSSTSGLQQIIAADTVSSSNGFSFGVNGAGLQFNAHGVQAYDTTSVTLAAGTWTHVAAVVSDLSGFGNLTGLAVTFYVDGVLQQTITGTLPVLTDDDDEWLIGQGLAGTLDELAVYDRALSPAQIQAIANPGSSGIESLELGLLHLQNWGHEELVGWQPVSLAQSGTAFTNWSARLPENEGPHQIYLRAADGFTHSLTLPNVWQGEIDTQAPRAQLAHYTPRFPGDRDIYRCWAEDYNLSERDYACPVAGSAPGYQDAAWYTAVFSQAKLYTYASPPAYATNPEPADRLTACDGFGNCTTVLRTTTSLSWPLGVAILTPTSHSLYTALAPIELAGAAYAEAGLKDLVVAVDGNPIYTQTWGVGTTTTPWTTSFIPGAEGALTILATVRDQLDNVITSAAPISASPGLETVLLVDTSSPGLDLITNRISGQNWAGGFIHLEGQVSEATQLASLQISLNGGAWQDILHSDAYPLVDSPWDVNLYSASPIPPSGQTLTITIRATDGAGHTVELAYPLWADAVAPEAVQFITLTYASGTVVAPGMTVWDVASPTLAAAWTASPSPDTVAYTFEWLEQLPGVQTQLVRQTELVTATQPRQATYDAGEPQKLWGRLTSRDAYDNAGTQIVGPLYVDYEHTPVYVDMGGGETGGQPYRGWLQAPCNLLGEDGRLAGRAQDLYTAWDEEGLRMTWTGANWNNDGDLFIYLDTDPSGGSVTAYDPYSVPGDEVYMPTYRVQTTTYRMAADYVLWVRDGVSVTLKHYSGTLWSDVSAPGLSYVFDANLQTPHSDLVVPFSSLGIADPAGTSLSLVAFASDDDALRVWAAQPPDNPVNSARVTGHTPSGPLALTHLYNWRALSSGVCPKDGRFSGPHVQVSLASQPAGIAYSWPGNAMPASIAGQLAALIGWQSPQSAVCLADPNDPACGKRIDTGARVPFSAQMELARLLNIAAPAVGDKQAITITLSLVNAGSAPATGVLASIRTWGHLRIALTQTTPISLAAGQSSELILNGVIDLAHDPTGDNGWATLDVVVLDDNSLTVTPDTYDYPVDWLYVDYELDQAAPDYIEIQTPPGLIGPGETAMGGFVYDQSSVPTVTLELKAPDEGTTTFTCPDATPADRQWTCAVDVGEASEGQVFDLRVQATDGYGQASPWFAYGQAGSANGQPFVVDATPPTFTLGSAAAVALSDGWLNAAELNWSGDTSDNRLVDTVMVCDPAGAQPCQAANAVLAPGALPTTTYVYNANLLAYSIDAAAACGGVGQISVPFTVTEAFTVADVSVGLNLTHTRRSDVTAYLYAPSGISVTLLRGASSAQDYDLLLDDTAAVPNWKDTLNHNTASPYYDNTRRSFELLSRMNGQASQGTWRLVVCDARPGEHDGVLLNGQLSLKAVVLPADTSAAWQYSLPGAGMDGVAQTRQLYAVDSVGNRSEVATLTFQVDTVAPLITVTQLYTDAFDLVGDLSDGGGIKLLRLVSLSPGGSSQSQIVTNQAGEWSFSGTPSPLEEGVYTLWLEAEDVAGNRRRVGPFEVIVPARPNLITGVTPANGELGVARNRPIVIEFSEAIQTESISLTIQPSTLLTPTWDSAATRLSLAHPYLEADTAYTVSVVTGTNTVGEWIENAPYTWVFSTSDLIAGEADLMLAKSSAQTSVSAGQPVTYTFTITNLGPVSQTTVSLVDTFNYGDILATVSGPGCEWPRGSAVVTCTLTVSSALATRLVLTVTTDVGYYGPLRNTASIVLPADMIDPNPLNNEAGPVVVAVNRVHRIYLPVVIKNG
ncbi:MAG: Ig-like domain-containing protein [Thermoflexales bacterium]|nr:Ig-like domain-containing protein [Thermoflexales bacterium]